MLIVYFMQKEGARTAITRVVVKSFQTAVHILTDQSMHMVFVKIVI